MIRINLLVCSALLLILASLNPVTARAWGPEGHVQVGMLAVENLDPTARTWLREMLGTNDVAAIDKACNWPDQIRDTRGWEWSGPQHYVNIPRSASHYDRERDCPDGLCVTEAIKKYAGQLGDPRLDDSQIEGRKQWEAFAWLCHLVGDLHQPLHAGYRDDRGGNDVEVSYMGEAMNLHQFWDRAVIREYLGTRWRLAETAFVRQLSPHRQAMEPGGDKCLDRPVAPACRRGSLPARCNHPPGLRGKEAGY